MLMKNYFLAGAIGLAALVGCDDRTSSLPTASPPPQVKQPEIVMTGKYIRGNQEKIILGGREYLKDEGYPADNIIGEWLYQEQIKDNPKFDAIQYRLLVMYNVVDPKLPPGVVGDLNAVYITENLKSVLEPTGDAVRFHFTKVNGGQRLLGKWSLKGEDLEIRLRKE
jgi:hypothetical protein